MSGFRWGYVVAAGALYLGLAAINEFTGTNLGWYVALFVAAGVLLSSGAGNAALDWITGTINRMAESARGG